jgi:adenine-specific DNA-methyltransferase
MEGRDPNEILDHIQSHLIGWEIDPFAGWLTQVFVEVAMKDILNKTTRSLKPIVKICNSLEAKIDQTHSFDLVIGNPPYGKLKLTDEIRTRFRDSLYGHANLYSIFTHLALELVAPDGLIAYLTPTSYLSGEYFKKLREFLRKPSSPIEIDFVSIRKGVFDDALQETMLTLHKKTQIDKPSVLVNRLCILPKNKLLITPIGHFFLPQSLSSPWIFPRAPEQTLPVKAMQNMKTRLSNWGYKVSTGPLVWNRHKSQLTRITVKNTFPIIWAESITANGKFILRSQKPNHKPYFQYNEGDEWLVNKNPCILLQRTTSKEQDKRLIAAPLPDTLYKTGVVIENHLNMIIAVTQNPLVAPAVLSIFLNSKAVNEAFRSISGSVAISAYELESFPLPKPEELSYLIKLIEQNSNDHMIERACADLYNISV